MKRKFLSKLSKYIFFSICFLLFFEFYIFPKTINVMSFKNKLLKDNKNTEVLILGNSHTMVGVDPEVLSYKSINIANDSRKLITDYYILKKNIDNLKDLKAVIFPISYYTFFINKLSENEKRVYFNFYNLDEYNQGIVKNRIIGNMPLKEHFNNVLFDFNGRKNFTSKGKKRSTTSYIFNKKLIKHRIGEVDGKILDGEAIKENIHFLNKMIKLCDVKEVKLFILLPPYHPDFNKFGGSLYTSNVEKIVIRIVDKTSAVLIDSKHFDLDQSKYFNDVDHLNDNGAYVLTKKIDSMFKKHNI